MNHCENQFAAQLTAPLLLGMLALTLLWLGFDDRRWRTSVEPAAADGVSKRNSELEATEVLPPQHDFSSRGGASSPLPWGQSLNSEGAMHTAPFTESTESSNTALVYARQELLAARAEWQAEQARWQAESNYYSNAAEQAAAIGAYLASPEPPNMQLQMRYQRALAEYQRLGGR